MSEPAWLDGDDTQKLDEAIQALNECNDILDELLATGRIYLNHVSDDAS